MHGVMSTCECRMMISADWRMVQAEMVWILSERLNFQSSVGGAHVSSCTRYRNCWSCLNLLKTELSPDQTRPHQRHWDAHFTTTTSWKIEMLSSSAWTEACWGMTTEPSSFTFSSHCITFLLPHNYTDKQWLLYSVTFHKEEKWASDGLLLCYCFTDNWGSKHAH